MGLALAVQLGALRSIDRELLVRLQSAVPPQLDVVGSVVTLFGHAAVTAGIAAGLVVARLRARRADVWVPLAIAITVILEVAGKLLVAQPLPPRDLHRDLGFLSDVSVPFSHAFPSGHVARDTFLLLIIHDWPRIAVGVALVLVAVSRVYLGQHWPSDALGGLFLGAGVAWAALAVAERRRSVSRP